MIIEEKGMSNDEEEDDEDDDDVEDDMEDEDFDADEGLDLVSVIETTLFLFT